jgi:carboxyl-terminal processing protease
MMRAAPKVLLVGDRSYGSSGNPKPHEIGGGISVLLPSWKDYLPNGTLLEGSGIVPDVSVPPGADDFQTTDPVLDVALARLRK